MRSTKLVASLFFLSLGAIAQSDRGTITGTVSDPAGAVVANAQIQARSLETDAVYPAATARRRRDCGSSPSALGFCC